MGHLGTVFNEMAAQVERRQAILADQDWLKTALSTFSLAFQRQRDPTAIGTMVLGDLAVLLDIRHSVLYRYVDDDGGPAFRLCASYAADNPQADWESARVSWDNVASKGAALSWQISPRITCG